MSRPISPEISRQWAKFIRKTELILESRGLERVFTPSLVVNPGMEAHLNAFQTTWRHGSSHTQFYLPTSPELHLKQMLANGYENIYEIKTCFRNDELSEIHEPEFFMLEWYRANADLNAIREDLKCLVSEFLPKLQWTTKTMAQLFKENLNFTLRPETSSRDLYELASRLGVQIPPDDSFDDMFNFIFVEKIEPHLSQYEALLLHDYPPSQAALARLTNEGFAGRMELYLNGIEIANAFDELTEAHLNRERLMTDLSLRKELGKELYPIDENFMRSLEKGMPPSGGIALGLDRLFMAIYGFKTIQETRVFPVQETMKGFVKT